MSADAVVVEARRLTKRFGALAALDHVDLTVRRGQALALFGPNGAGKTTLIRLLSSMLRPTSGSVRLAGRDPFADEQEARSLLGVVSHQTFLYDGLTAMENLRFFASLYGVPDPEARARALLRSMDLTARAEDPAGHLSRGMQQRLSLARALIHDPSVLLLDEPFTGLDPRAAGRFRELLSELRSSSRTIVLVTHDLGEGLRLCDSWLILAGGRIRGSGRTEGLDRASFEPTYLHLAGGSPA